MKNYFLFLFTALAFVCSGQGLYMKSETEVKGLPGFIANHARTTSYAYYTPERCKIEVCTRSYTQTQIVDGKGATVIDRMGKKNKDCAFFSREEMNGDSLENDMATEKISVQYTDEAKKILDYTCKKVVINYSMVQLGTVDAQMILWCTDEIRKPDNTQLPELNKRNSLFKAIYGLKGVPLETESIMTMNNVRTITTVTEVSTGPFGEPVFSTSESDCKKTLDLKEYKALVAKRKRESRMMGY